ncbi:hypothetical protein HHI36_013412 [Cryptolaemus montrouzieri]|uniref:Uncharacterized protein n=1 Tax=Cryptolaemus montrouzieri TaxID=559131 RepID=A0ABD2NHE8_9CUCU
MRQKTKKLKTAEKLLGLAESKKSQRKRVCRRSEPMSDADSSEELLKLCDDDDFEESDEGSREEFDIMYNENNNKKVFI